MTATSSATTELVTTITAQLGETEPKPCTLLFLHDGVEVNMSQKRLFVRLEYEKEKAFAIIAAIWHLHKVVKRQN